MRGIYLNFFQVFVIENSMLALFLQLSKPEKVVIPERYVELEPEEPLSTEELAARQRKAEKIKNILTKSRLGFRAFFPALTQGLMLNIEN